jgi:hypothetical protein
MDGQEDDCTQPSVSMRRLATALVLLLVTLGSARAETVCVKYGSCLDLAPFDCTDTPQSSFIRRVCYDPNNSYMLIQLNAVWYHYCEIDSGTVSLLLSAPSVAQGSKQAARSILVMISRSSRYGAPHGAGADLRECGWRSSANGFSVRTAGVFRSCRRQLGRVPHDGQRSDPLLEDLAHPALVLCFPLVKATPSSPAVQP